jgi:membrane protein
LKKKTKFQFDRKKIYKEIKYFAVGIYNKFDEDHVWVLSSGIAFNIVICAIPFSLILLSVLGLYLNSETTIEKINAYLNHSLGMPAEIRQKAMSIIQGRTAEISNNITLTAIIGGIGILWTASGLFSTMRDVLNRVYKTKLEVFYVWGKLKDIGMVFFVLLFFVLSFASTIIISIIRALDKTFLNGLIHQYSVLRHLIGFGIGLIFSFIMFYLIYKLVPNGKVNTKIALVSAITGAFLWEVLKTLFTVYLVNFANYAAIYGTYAAIVALIFWIYYSSFVFVLGAEAGQLYNEKILLKD